MSNGWKGERTTDRLQVSPSEELPGYYVIHGKETNHHGLARPADMVRMARSILKNLRRRPPAPPEPDGAVENGRYKPPLRLRQELELVHGLNESAIEALTGLWLDPLAGNSLGEAARTGGALKALGEYLLDETLDLAREMKADNGENVLFGEEIDLPFIARLKPRNRGKTMSGETGKKEKHTVHVRSHAGARGAFGVCIRSETGKITLGQSFRDNSPFTWELAGIAAGLEHVPGEGQEVELTVTAQYMASRVRDFLEGGPIRGGNEELWERVRKAARKHQVQVKHARFPVLEEETVTAAGAALIASMRQEDGFLRVIRTGRKSP